MDLYYKTYVIYLVDGRKRRGGWGGGRGGREEKREGGRNTGRHISRSCCLVMLKFISCLSVRVIIEVRAAIKVTIGWRRIQDVGTENTRLLTGSL